MHYMNSIRLLFRQIIFIANKYAWNWIFLVVYAFIVEYQVWTHYGEILYERGNRRITFRPPVMDLFCELQALR